MVKSAPPPPNRIAELCAARKISYHKLGAACMPAMTASQISKRALGQVPLKDREIIEITRVLGCHPGELFAPLFSQEEKAHLDLLRALPEDERKTLFRVADALAKSPDSDGVKAPRRISGTKSPSR